MNPIALSVVIVFIVIAIVYISTLSNREKEVQIKNVILYVTKPIEHKETANPQNVLDKNEETSWNPIMQNDKNYILGFDFNQIKNISRVKIISSKTKSYNSINELKIRMSNGELVYDTAKSIKQPLASNDSTENIKHPVEPQVIDINLSPSITCDRLLLEFFCDTINESSCDVREVMFFEKKKSLF